MLFFFFFALFWKFAKEYNSTYQDSRESLPEIHSRVGAKFEWGESSS